MSCLCVCVCVCGTGCPTASNVTESCPEEVLHLQEPRLSNGDAEQAVDHVSAPVVHFSKHVGHCVPGKRSLLVVGCVGSVTCCKWDRMLRCGYQGTARERGVKWPPPVPNSPCAAQYLLAENLSPWCLDHWHHLSTAPFPLHRFFP